MDQTTAFSPPLYVKLVDGRLVKFARSVMDHWITLSEEMIASKRDRLLADIDAAKDLKPIERINARDQAWDAMVSIDRAIDRCRQDARWIKRHLTLAFVEAGGAEADADAVLNLIPSTVQWSIADQIAMMPVVKAAKVGTEANPLVAGLDYDGADSTGARSAPSSNDGIPNASPADAPTDS